MGRKNKLLLIGEISKLTGAGIKSLRYYERINILKPAYIDPNSGYRYYSFNQTNLVYLIMFCIELDIPLKELSEFIDGQDTVNYRAFLAHGKAVAQEKMRTLKKGLGFINFLEQKLALQEEYPLGPIYTRELPEKYFYVIPYGQTFEDADQNEVAKLFFDAPNYESDNNEWLEYGLLCEHSLDRTYRYAFVEVPQDKASLNCRAIPAGQYYCRQNDISQIEQAGSVFRDYLNGENSFLAIETEVFSDKFNINKPINELRVIVMPGGLLR